ncbi:MAG TPA: DUF2254 domain-containing protein [Gaiellaceae bacterium]|nr:DUF2254 domain-containing protein [Gaiellaceae bacterium]
MSWSRRFRRRERIRGSLWIVPLLGAILGVIAGVLLWELDQHLDVPGYFQYSSSTASTVLSAIVGAAAALIGFVVTVTTLMVQMVTGTFSPRYMRLWYRDPLLKGTLALLAGTLTFSLSMLRRIEPNDVPSAGVSAAGVLIVASLILFLLFFDRCMFRLRPVAVAALVARAGRKAFEDAREVVSRSDVGVVPPAAGSEPSRVVRADSPGAIQAIHLDGLVRWAREHDARLVFEQAVGDFVPTGGRLISVYGGSGSLEDAERELNTMVALGDERTIQQDPAFAIRIMVDIALMALSPAVNAPTTATQVIGHLGETLRMIGSTELGHGPEAGDAGEAAVVIRTHTWEDFLTLGATEIREYGAAGIQVMRAMRAMLEELLEEVLPDHRAAVEEELARLDATLASHWGDSVDLDRARVADHQGIGGPGAAA